MASARVFNSAGEEVGLIAEGIGFWVPPQGLKAQEGAFVPDQGQQGLIDVIGTGYTIFWDGANSQGQWVDSGAYTVVLSITDSFGAVTIITAKLTVLRAPNTLELAIFNSAGERVRRILLPENASFSLDEFAWDGRDERGQPVSQGSYMAVLTRSGPDGKSVQSRHLSLLYGPGPAAAAPRLLELGKGRALLQTQPGSSARVYTLAAELVRQAGPASSNGELELDLNGFAEGIYLIQLEIPGPRGIQRHRIKWAYLR
jgi:hypothetical protein